MHPSRCGGSGSCRLFLRPVIPVATALLMCMLRHPYGGVKMTANDLSPDYKAVLADLRAKRDKLSAAISALEELWGVAPGDEEGHDEFPVPPNRSNAGSSPAVIQSDAFFGLSIVEASKKLLGMAKRPQSAEQIADALRRGGMLNTSKNFPNTVMSVLNRNDKAGGDIVKVGPGSYGLASWYPNRPKRRPLPKKDGEAEQASEQRSSQESSVEGESQPPELKVVGA